VCPFFPFGKGYLGVFLFFFLLLLQYAALFPLVFVLNLFFSLAGSMPDIWFTLVLIFQRSGHFPSRFPSLDGARAPGKLFFFSNQRQFSPLLFSFGQVRRGREYIPFPPPVAMGRKDSPPAPCRAFHFSLCIIIFPSAYERGRGSTPFFFSLGFFRGGLSCGGARLYFSFSPLAPQGRVPPVFWCDGPVSPVPFSCSFLLHACRHTVSVPFFQYLFGIPLNPSTSSGFTRPGCDFHLFFSLSATGRHLHLLFPPHLPVRKSPSPAPGGAGLLFFFWLPFFFLWDTPENVPPLSLFSRWAGLEDFPLPLSLFPSFFY